MPRTVDFLVELEVIVCGGCGITFAFPGNIVRARQRDHKTFYCPNGCPRAFNGESDLDALKKQLKAERQAVDQLRAEVTHQRDQREATERSLRATRGALTRTKNRIANGICPCCHRTFQDLAEHMQNKHPSYEEEAS